jgi:hypothetical protein
MQGHQRQDYERLRAEGRWAEANAFRETERKRLLAEGRTRQQACDESWQEMLEKFPPLNAAQDATDGEPFRGPDVIDGKLWSEMLWVLAALEHHRPICADEAPSDYLREVLARAQRERYRFVVRLLQFLLDKPTRLDEILPRIDGVLEKWDRESVCS